MERNEALEAIADAYTVVEPQYAMDVCVALGVPFKNELVVKGVSDRNVVGYKGLQMKEGCEGKDCVHLSELSEYVLRHFGLKAPQFLGRGRQARMNADVVRKHLGGVEGG